MNRPTIRPFGAARAASSTPMRRVRPTAAIAALLAFIPACEPHVVTRAELRTPAAVAVDDAHGRPLLYAGTGVQQTVTWGTLGASCPIVVRRDADAALSIGPCGLPPRPLVDAAGVVEADTPAGFTRTAPPDPRIDGDRLRMTVPYRYGREARHFLTQVDVVAPLDDVVRVTQTREPKGSGGLLLVYGLILITNGAALAVHAATHSGLHPGERAAEAALSTALVVPGALAVTFDLYGLLAPRTQRTLYSSTARYAPSAPR